MRWKSLEALSLLALIPNNWRNNIYQTIPEEARNEQTMDKLFTDLRALSTDQPVAANTRGKGQSML